MGMNLFGDIMEQSYINRHANFQTFAHAMLTLFRCAPVCPYIPVVFMHALLTRTHMVACLCLCLCQALSCVLPPSP